MSAAVSAPGKVRQIFGPALHSISAQAFAAGVGYLFWMLVTQTSSVAVTGLASSTISAASATALLCSVGIAYSQLPGAKGASQYRDPGLGLGMTVCTSLAGAAVLLAFSPWLVPELGQAGWLLRGEVFCLSVATAVGMYLDYVGLANARSWTMLMRSLIAVLGRLTLLAAAVASALALRPDLIVGAWTLALALSLAPSAWVLKDAWTPSPEVRGMRLLDRLKGQSRTWIGNHSTSVGGVAGPLILPVIVLNVLGKHDAGIFYPTWMLGSMFFMISPAIVGATLSKAASPGGDGDSFKSAARLTAALLVPTLLVALIFPQFLLGLFGAEYAASGSTLLRVLALSAIPDALSNLGVAVLRRRGKFRKTATINTVITASTLVLAGLLLPMVGILGAGIGWLLGQVLGTALAAVFLARGRRPAPASSSGATA